MLTSPNRPAAAPALRPYQATSIDNLARALRDHPSACYVLPTGGGKTTVAASIMQRTQARGSRLWFIAHRTELISQAAARFGLFGADVGIIDPHHPFQPEKLVQVGMVQTLARRLKKVPADQHPDYLIIDECHRAKAGQYCTIREHFSSAKVIGLTATPYRTDGSGLADVFKHLVVGALPADLIREGYLTSCRYYTAERDLEGIKVTKGDYDERQTFSRYDQQELYAGTVENWRKYAQGLPTVVFCINVKHSQATAAEFNRAGIPAIHLDGETPPEERQQAIADFTAGKYKVVCNVGLFTEGTDIPGIGCVLMNRPTKSRALWMQCVGRGVRPLYACGVEPPTAAERVAQIAAGPKPHCIVIDQGQNFRTHGAYEAEKMPSLNATRRKRSGASKERPTHKACPQCDLQLIIQARDCPSCGYHYLTKPERANSTAFVEVTAESMTMAKKKRGKKPKVQRPKLPCHLRGIPWIDMTREQLVEVQKLWKFKPGWVHYQLKLQQAKVERVQAEQQRLNDLETLALEDQRLRALLEQNPEQQASIAEELAVLREKATQLASGQ